MTGRIETYGLASETYAIIARKESDVNYHTTKKTVGNYHVSWIHLNNQKPLPLPVVPVSGETREYVAKQAVLGFQI